MARLRSHIFKIERVFWVQKSGWQIRTIFILKGSNCLILIYNSVLAKHQQMDELQFHDCPSYLGMESAQVGVGFQKNYPKNIFIPIIEYLCDLGLQESYQRSVGTRQLFEGKNVVSLAVIHQLITQKWFTQTVCRQHCLAIVCRKIMLNSKIKKKIFHLKMAQTIISSQIPREKEFKTFIGKQVSSISTSNVENDQFLYFTNLTIYLLHLTAKVICTELHSQPCVKHFIKNTQKHQFAEHNESDEESQSHLSSKQELKMYLKLIIWLFNDQQYRNEQFRNIYEKLNIAIGNKQSQFQEKYGLAKGIANLSIFMTEVAQKLFQHKQKEIKITNLLLNQWIDGFKRRFLKLEMWEKADNNMRVEQQITDHEQICKNTVLIHSFEPRPFCPYVFAQMGQS